MTFPLLQSKLFVPPTRPALVPRPRLLDQLNAGLHRKLTLVSAPAGFGKTTLVSSWVAGDKRPVAWLSLDEGDSDPLRFVTYLVAALQGIEVQIREETRGLLQGSKLPPVEVLLTALLNEISAIEESFTLVLDDYHALESSWVDEALTFLLDYLPPPMHLVLVTREDPQLPLARLRVRNQVTELRARALRFTPAEAATFLNQVMGLDLSAEEIRALEWRTEGWIAGLQMAALSMQGRSDSSAFIRAFTGSHRFVLDYLMEEVLHRQPGQVRDFLLRTSILERLNGSLCDAVTGQEDSAARLESLERGNLFVVPLDDERQWYRYHHFFADVLRARLREEQPGQLAALHQWASEWFERHDSPSEAVHHALAAEDWERVADLAEGTWRAMDRSYQSATWLRWVQALPDEVVRARPVICGEFAWALLDVGEMEAAERRLRDAERWLALCGQGAARPAEMVVVDEREFRSLPTTVANARAYHAQAVGDPVSAVRYARQALALSIERTPFERGLSALLLGFAQWASGELAAARHAVADAVASMWTATNIPFAISFTSYLADILLAEGRLNEAIRTYQRALRRATEQGKPVARETAVLHLGLCELYHEQGKQEAARRHLSTGEALGKQAAFPPWQRHWSYAQARMKEAEGDLAGALAMLHELEQRSYRHAIPDVRPVSAAKVRLWIAQGNVAEAQAWVRERGLSVEDDLSYLREFEHMTLARVLIAHYRRTRDAATLAAAAGLLARLLHAAEVGQRQGSLLELLVLQTLAHEAQGETSAALAALEQALTRAEPEGYGRLFVDEGPPMAALLREAARRGIAPTYVRLLLAGFGEAEESRAVAQQLVDPLSERELEVLDLLRTELNGPEIAHELVISLNTMRTHTKRIYSKLGVNSRRAAVRRARELDLF